MSAISRTLALVLGAGLLVACGSDDESSAPRGGDAGGGDSGSSEPFSDPAKAGPYDVGATELTFERQDTATGDPRALDVVVWYPADASGGKLDATLEGVRDAPLAEGAPWPLILFSHGSGGSPLQSKFLMGHLASHGFVVAAVPHPGNTFEDCGGLCSEASELARSAQNRPDDVMFSTDSVFAEAKRSGSLLEGAIDETRLGASGHSFGGWTTLEVLKRDDRFAAGMPLAPGGPFSGYDGVTSPLMFITGERDGTTTYDSVRDVYENQVTGTKRHLLTLIRGGHMSFIDLCDVIAAFDGCSADDLDPAAARAITTTYAAAFFKTTVTGAAGYEEYLEPAGSLADGEARLEVLE